MSPVSGRATASLKELEPWDPAALATAQAPATSPALGGKRLTVCHVISSLMYGGGQSVALDLVRRLGREPDLDARLVLIGNQVADGLTQLDVPTTHVTAYDGRYNRPRSLARAAFALRRALRSDRTDIVHSHGWDCNAIVGLACAGLPIRHVVHQHVLADWVSSRRVVHVIRRGVTRVALGNRRTTWVAVSKAVKESMAGLVWLPQEAVRVLWNGVDLERFRPAATTSGDGVPVIGVAARLVPLKGLEYLIEALAILHRRGIECKLRIAGGGPVRETLAALAQSMGLSDRVALLGELRNIEDFYRSIDVLALPSLSEGLPLSVLEAMATGLPVVSTRVSGIPEAVLNGVSGTLVPPRDAPALADALEPLLRSKAMRERMGHAGRRRAEAEFSLERAAERIAILYREVAPSASPLKSNTR